MPRLRESAGLLMYRFSRVDQLEVLLAHPGGSHWKDRHVGAWTIPKGGLDEDEAPLDAAIREFQEETGFEPSGPYEGLGTIIQRSRKVVHAWAFEGDCDPAASCSNTTSTQWPPRSGNVIEIPEVDEVRFFSIEDARRAINTRQAALLDRLLDYLGQPADAPGQGFMTSEAPSTGR